MFQTQKMNKKKGDRHGVVYSTNNDYEYDYSEDQEDTLDPEDQELKIYIDRKHRKGKSVTIVSGFIGTDEDLKDLGKLLKTKCGTGGSVKDGEIIIQGEMINKVKSILTSNKYNVK